MRRALRITLGLLLASNGARAGEPIAELPLVAVQGEGTAARESKPVADLLDALDTFERERARYAPQAEFRIRVLPRHDLREAEAIALELRHGHTRMPIALDALGRFSIPPDWRQLPKDAVVRSPLPLGRLSWMVDVRTPGLPAHSRRLGDLRLECRADLYGGNLMRGLKPPAYYALRASTDVCSSTLIAYGFFADAPVFTARIHEGDRVQEHPYALMHGSLTGQSNLFFPLVDWPYALRDRFVELAKDKWKTWSHEARIELDPMQPETATP